MYLKKGLWCVAGLIGVSVMIELIDILRTFFKSKKTPSPKIHPRVQEARLVLQNSGYKFQDDNTDLNCVLFFPDPGIACHSLVTKTRTCSYPNCKFLHDETSLLMLGKILNLAKHELNVCVYVITCEFLQKVIVDSRKRGVFVRVISDKGQAEQAQGAHRIQGVLLNQGVNVRVSKSVNLMHHKFALVDGQILINGSFNWTRQAIVGNYENLIISSSPDLVQPYVEEFERIWAALAPDVVQS